MFCAVFLEGYFTYFHFRVRYNGFADEENLPSPPHERRSVTALKSHGVISAEGYDQMKKNHSKYTTDLPRRLYTFFLNYDGPGAPSFSKFARSIGHTLTDIEKHRRHSEFERAYQECSEIRRDYLIDNGLVKRFDSSLTKFLLSSEYGMGDTKGTGEDKEIKVTLEVIGDED